MKKQFGDYYIGLDLGTNSIGWAVTDLNYNLLKLNGKALWGIRLFDEAQTAASMRTTRAARRRIARMTWRLKLLQEIFAEEISKVDPGFFLRIKESNLQIEQKSVNNKIRYSLFGKDFLSDKDYYEKYPTIYHLRNALLNDEADAFDVRLVYLAIAHILKHRGHFLFEGVSGEVGDFSTVYNELVEYIKDNLDGFEEWQGGESSKVEEILKDRTMPMSVKKTKLIKVLGAETKQEKSVAAFMSGSTANLNELFNDDSLKETEKNKISFKNDNFDEILPIIESVLGERTELVEKLKAVYDWSLFAEILRGKTMLSEAKVEAYKEHEADLKALKELLKDNRVLYNKVFSSEKEKNNYCKYVGSVQKAKGKKVFFTPCSQSEFCKYLIANLKDIVDINNIPANMPCAQQELLIRIKNETAFPKQRGKANGVIPMQANLSELMKIIANAEKHLSFLGKKDSSGFSAGEKIIEIMKFRIPYYVGPLAGTEMTRAKKRCWVVRSDEKITPWNFDKVVDKTASAEKFICNMTNKCTYLEGEDVLPKESLLYAEFMLRNELNNLTVNGEKLPAKVIDSIIEKMIVNGKGKITKNKIAGYLKSEGLLSDKGNDVIGGIDDVVKSDLKAYKDFSRIFDRRYIAEHYDEIEEIIKWITLFSDEKGMLINKIKTKYPKIGMDKLKQIKNLKYKEWGRLSQTLLNSNKVAYVDEGTGEIITIIGAMRIQTKNLMELLSTSCQYGFIDKIKSFNSMQKKSGEVISYETVAELATSPANKRTIWQTMLIVKEIKKITGHSPKRVFVEMPRGEEEKKRTRSRKEQLLEYYMKAADSIEPELKNELEAVTEENLRSRKLFFYFTQLGRCMYTGKRINITDLYSKENGADLYDRDHIFPRSKTKDDSLDNLVLVYYKENREKTDEYPLKPEIQQRMGTHWKLLRDMGLISQKKYERLTRKSMLTDEELAGFINRQLVETQQSTKIVAELLKLECGETTEIAYSKAGNISDFRQEFDFVKCRMVNDLHHAKDAYLNIVVGNAYHTKFTANPYYFIHKNKNERYTLKTKELFARDIKRGNVTAWVAGEDGTLATVSKVMRKNNVLFTRMAQENKGQLYDVQILSKGKGQVPLKKNLPIEFYGGYNSPSSAYFMLVASIDNKGNRIKTIETVPMIMAKKIQENKADCIEFLQKYCALKEPQVLVNKILKYSLLNINGTLMNITGKTGSQITGMMAAQLILNKHDEIYLKRVEKFIERFEKNNNIRITEFDKITSEENKKLYTLLIEKHKSNAYNNRPAGQLKLLQANQKAFEELPLEKQCIVLSQILNLFVCKSVSANLELIGGNKMAGTFKIAKNITKCKKALLVNQSVTGAFEQQMDLLKL